MKADHVPGGLPRAVEIVLAIVGLSALGPLFVLIALAIRLSSPGPIFFRQQRVGRGGRPFELIKFRTMATGGPRQGGGRVTISGDRRITSVGRLLRASKLDELPELMHIVRGEMSFVGPRPEVPAFVDLEDPRWRFILRARPGLTDPVTLRLRNEESLLAALCRQMGSTGGAGSGGGEDVEEVYERYLKPWKLRGYAEYLRRRSAWKDLGVIVATVLAIVDPSRADPPGVDEILAGVSNDA